MGRLRFKGNFVFATAVVIAVIVYGSLWAFLRSLQSTGASARPSGLRWPS
jgi:hypothetical protein